MKRFDFRRSLARIASYGRRLAASPAKLNWDDRCRHGHPGFFGEPAKPAAEPDPVFGTRDNPRGFLAGRIMKVGYTRFGERGCVSLDVWTEAAGQVHICLDRVDYDRFFLNLAFAGIDAWPIFDDEESGPDDDDDDLDEALANVGVTGI